MDNNKKIHSLLASFDTAMLISSSGKLLHARPMAIASLDDSSDLWFITSEQTEKIEEILAHPDVHVTCQRDHSAYVSLSGTASISRDKSKIKELWKESFRVWFPKGVEDQSIVLISFKPNQGEYWDNRGMNGIKYIYQAITAYVSGSTPAVKDGEQHGTVVLK